MQGAHETKQEKDTLEIIAYSVEGDVSRIYGIFEGNLTNGISLYIEPSESSDPEKLKFKVRVLDFSSELLKLQLLFENPAYVSSFAEKEVLVINLNDFRDQDD